MVMKAAARLVTRARLRLRSLVSLVRDQRPGPKTTRIGSFGQPSVFVHR